MSPLIELKAAKELAEKELKEAKAALKKVSTPVTADTHLDDLEKAEINASKKLATASKALKKAGR